MHKPIQQVTTTIIFCAVLTACGSTATSQSTAQTNNSNQATTKTTTKSATRFNIAHHSPYLDEQVIQSNIINECTQLGVELSNWTEHFSEKQGLDIERQQTFDQNSEGQNLKIEITNAASNGATGASHAKSVTIKATLFKNGEEIDSYRASRSSNGGFFGGFKSSCSVLNRCVKTLGSDISNWLKQRKKNS